MAALIQFRQDTSANWAAANPVLKPGEPGWAWDTGNLKIGDGITPWNNLNLVNIASPTVASLSDNTSPTPPANSNSATIYARSLAGRMMLNLMGYGGVNTTFQTSFARNKIGVLSPAGNSTTLLVLGSYTTPTTAGTATARNVAVTNMFTRTRRLGIVSAATASSITSMRVSLSQISVGGASGAGFFKITRFGVSDASIVTGARMFVGVTAATGAPTNVEPSTLVNAIGVGKGLADTNLKLFYGGSVAQTPIDLGVNFPANTTNTDFYELVLHATPESPDVYYQVTRLNTGHTVAGVISNTGTTVLPGASTLLTYMMAWRSNGSTASAVGLDIVSDYIETEN